MSARISACCAVTLRSSCRRARPDRPRGAASGQSRNVRRLGDVDDRDYKPGHDGVGFYPSRPMKEREGSNQSADCFSIS